MSDVNESIAQYKKQLIKTWIRLEAYGAQSKILPQNFPEQLESDGRKRNKAINNLCNEGYLNLVDGRLHVTDKAFKQYKSVKPDFSNGLASLDERSYPVGFKFLDLQFENIKYIIEHKSEYKFFYMSDRNNNERYITEFGVAPIGDKTYNLILMVKDVEYDAIREQALAEREFQSARKQNLYWGLEELGLLTKEEIDLIKNKTITTNSIFSPSAFKSEPASWQTDLVDEIERVRKRIDDSQKRLELIVQLQHNMNKYGGWDKFLAGYDSLIKKALLKQNEIDSACLA